VAPPFDGWMDVRKTAVAVESPHDVGGFACLCRGGLSPLPTLGLQIPLDRCKKRDKHDATNEASEVASLLAHRRRRLRLPGPTRHLDRRLLFLVQISISESRIAWAKRIASYTFM